MTAEPSDVASRRVFLVFASTHYAMAAEDLLRAASMRLQVVPTPPVSGKVCGLALRLAEADLDRAERALREAGVAWSVVLESAGG